MGVLLAILLGVVLEGLSQEVQAHEHAVVPLNTQNFEHKTQAASGQTTGSWFVYFGSTDDASDQQLWRAFAEQQREANPWVVHAFVDVEDSPELGKRFGIKGTPAFVLFRNRKMYKFPTSATSIEPVLIDALTTFSTTGWRSLSGEAVPQGAPSQHGFSMSTALLLVGGAIALLAAILGEPLLKYFKAAVPPTAGRAKEQ